VRRTTPQTSTSPNNFQTRRGDGGIPSNCWCPVVTFEPCPTAPSHYNLRQRKPPSPTRTNHINCEHIATSDTSTTHFAQNALHLDHLQHPTTPNIARGGGIPSRTAPAGVQWSRLNLARQRYHTTILDNQNFHHRQASTTPIANTLQPQTHQQPSRHRTQPHHDHLHPRPQSPTTCHIRSLPNG